MPKLIECIPNFSEGKDRNIIDGLVNTIKNIKGVTLLNYSSDVNHNRTGITFMGDEKSVVDGAFSLIKYATEHIDMNNHEGGHPRMGATDVCPFVPLKNITTEECVELAHQLAKKVNDELDVPIFLYEDAASDPSRVNLADVRRGEFEGMAEKLKVDDWAPDYGSRDVHPTAGVTAIGVRKPLVAFNVNLDTDDVSIAKIIAKAVRGSSGGYKYVKAIGLLLEDENLAQVSMNMVDYEKTPLHRVLETIRSETTRHGVSIKNTELYGLTPAKALTDAAEFYLGVKDFDSDKQIIENHLLQ